MSRWTSRRSRSSARRGRAGARLRSARYTSPANPHTRATRTGTSADPAHQRRITARVPTTGTSHHKCLIFGASSLAWTVDRSLATAVGRPSWTLVQSHHVYCRSLPGSEERCDGSVPAPARLGAADHPGRLETTALANSQYLKEGAR